MNSEKDGHKSRDARVALKHFTPGYCAITKSYLVEVRVVLCRTSNIYAFFSTQFSFCFQLNPTKHRIYIPQCLFFLFPPNMSHI